MDANSPSAACRSCWCVLCCLDSYFQPFPTAHRALPLSRSQKRGPRHSASTQVEVGLQIFSRLDVLAPYAVSPLASLSEQTPCCQNSRQKRAAALLVACWSLSFPDSFIGDDQHRVLLKLHADPPSCCSNRLQVCREQEPSLGWVFCGLLFSAPFHFSFVDSVGQPKDADLSLSPRKQAASMPSNNADIAQSLSWSRSSEVQAS